MRGWRWLGGALVAPLCMVAALAAPQEVSVWTEVEFDATGAVASLRFVDDEQYSAPFKAGLRERVMRLKLPPPQRDGRAVPLRSGLRLQVRWDDAAQPVQVQVSGMSLVPLVLSRDVAPIPDLHSDFDITYLADCLITTDGQCEVLEVSADGPVDELPRRWVLATLKLWRFQPPTLDGVPVPARLRVPVRLMGTPEAERRPPDFRLGTKLGNMPTASR